MATRRKTTPKKRAGRGRASLVCSRCGFKAAHPAGLGRHRSAMHGIVSQRQKSMGSARRSPNVGDKRLVKRVNDLERRVDRLLKGLEGILRQAKR